MHLTPQAQAVMLLTVSFGKSDSQDGKPFSNSEWAKFAIWLKDHGLEPAALLKGDLDSLLTGWVDRTVSIARIRALLGRGAALGLALEKWQRAGLWVLTRSDHEYPERLKRRLRSESPAVLFGCGNKDLLNTGGIAVVGSRDADDEDLAYTGRLGAEAAAQGYSLVSGGARGVDQSAMLGALESQGTAVGVLADSLLRSATSVKYRKHIMSGDLALISPFNPEAGFNVGHAMSRNRYIYCLADAAVVISSTRNKGGTWNGAIEDIRAGWVPLWVKPSSDQNSGNRELAQRGANWFPEDMTSLSKLFEGTHSAPLQNLGSEVPLIAQDNEQEAESDKERRTETSAPGKSSLLSEPLVDAPVTSGVSVPENSVLVDVDFYTLFLARIVEFASAAPMTVDDVAARLELEKAQVNAWLKRADDEGKVAKLTKPVRYLINPTARRQAALFG
ncbi:DNA-processing protein DprA [Stenotrophomonas sp. SORGH_AS_0321]|uniref:DNA-processing protein DprA n=1 Tax=Stenotrophomonas sp. SORGH_AS_0321 TaxID=3041787 RepID=UPI002857E228|nr:DNA-processing protein DprA [Stenotrophomonas sp. SORGH_AS_0321]MDR6095555.1 putative Rossmann fold nucleotide-binding protein DprA/Smf involved in DNA uptake [Stenotrophomonas sp. SORGH_AS_0321]